MIKKVLLTFLAAVLLFFIVVALVRAFSNEDTWICQDGKWVEHGSPKDEKPTIPCIK
jgi:hypothetical protein